MARINRITEGSKVRPGIHHETKCAGYIIHADGQVVIQLDTFGSKGRKRPDQISQSLQFTEASARQFLQLALKAFPDLNA